jgi:hypothetical protein
MTFTLFQKNGHFWTFLVKMLRMSQGKAKSHFSVYRWNQRWISFKLSQNNRNSGDHWKNVITGTLQNKNKVRLWLRLGNLLFKLYSSLGTNKVITLVK